ncbi:hypothetical protein Nepgr_028412 [Nepenthes gracilis]|uniref:Protein kinase domain-containing protein n=1 Tax=Nepenthes gracilis TaxID=150966 RepID=A0AAD3TCT8_NEPGR|nr:hypothetical protein Nepgr_028412 [Nepenthes gracilis]
MASTCIGPTTSGGTGFFQFVSAAVWRSRPPENTLPPPPNAGTAISNADSIFNNSSIRDSNAAHRSPPEKMTIPSSPKSEPQSQSLPPPPPPPRNDAAPNLSSTTNDPGRPKKPSQMNRTTGKEFACKSIAKRKLKTVEDVEDVRKEIQIMHHIAGHPNVIQIVGAYEDAVAVHVAMELCAGGELFDRIIQRGHSTERKAAELVRIVVGVVEECHSLGVMHRDLKPENFLFLSHEEDALLKTIDFGLSVFFQPGNLVVILSWSTFPLRVEIRSILESCVPFKT